MKKVLTLTSKSRMTLTGKRAWLQAEDATPGRMNIQSRTTQRGSDPEHFDALARCPEFHKGGGGLGFQKDKRQEILPLLLKNFSHIGGWIVGRGSER